MVSPVYSILWEQLKALKPSFLSKTPHFNFITVHYFWVVGITMLTSILLFVTAGGQLQYIDALFFAAGANTQAGLNPVDVNLLNTFQQIAIMICSMVSNPIALNSFVVFLRLFWFEKKFQGLVREARARRATITKTKSKAKPDPHNLGRGVDGRNILVMHGDSRPKITNDGFVVDGPNGHAAKDDTSTVGDSDERPTGEAGAEAVEEHGRNITFAGTVKRSDGARDEMLKLPRRRTDEEHIAILQRQRNADNDEVLRIPGPRDVERGQRPKRVEDNAPDETEPRSPGVRTFDDADQERATRPRGITIQEPVGKPTQEPAGKPSRKEEISDDLTAFKNVFTPFKIRKPRMLNDEEDHTHHNESDTPLSRMRRRPTFDTIRGALTRDRDDDAPYLSWQPTLGRNSQFIGELSDEQKEELGGIEYRSLKTLALILTCYFWGFWILGVVMLTPWIINSSYGSIVDEAGQSRVWWGFFTSSSAFMDLGFTLTPDSMNSFNTAVYPLLVMSFFIVIGNTGFPIMLRFIIWITSLFTPQHSGLYQELRFLLDHPRRCFTLLFPSAATWWLFWLLVILNGLDLIFFIVLDLGSGVVADLPTGIKILDGVFQAFSTRTAGFSCVNLSALHPGVQTSYMIMMYISIFPIAISVRRTNVYEEDSLGIYQDNNTEEDDHNQAGALSYVGAHLRRQLSFDLWYIFIGFFILSISEGGRIMTNDISMFAILFEIISAYGTVGLSLGYTNINASLSSQFSVIGKLVIIAMQIRGRHRGLPYGLDRAVLLPSEKAFRREAEGMGELGVQRTRTLPRRNSAISVGTDGRSMRGRSRSVDNRGVDRVNSNILTSFLHPGPQRPRRRMSEPEDDNSSTLGPAFDPYRSIPRRSETYSMSRRSVNNTRGREEV